MKILVINGPNLQLLGQREPEIYGKMTLSEINDSLKNLAKNLGNTTLDFFQSNCEGAIVDKIGSTIEKNYHGIILNPAAYFRSLAIYDALKAVKIPAIEVHLSNIQGREEFRKVSMTAGACLGQISGLGSKGYELALRALFDILKDK